MPYQAAQGGSAEVAAHAASHLGGDAQTVAMPIFHQHRFDAVAVRQPVEVLLGAVNGRYQPVQYGQLSQGAALRQLLTQGC